MMILAKVVAGIHLLSAGMVARWIRGPVEWDALAALSLVALLSATSLYSSKVEICVDVGVR